LSGPGWIHPAADATHDQSSIWIGIALIMGYEIKEIDECSLTTLRFCDIELSTLSES
jgi:hypothetical protein